MNLREALGQNLHTIVVAACLITALIVIAFEGNVPENVLYVLVGGVVGVAGTSIGSKV